MMIQKILLLLVCLNLTYFAVIGASPPTCPADLGTECATKYWPWEGGTNSLNMAKRRMRANFEFINKLGVDRWCFHDRDIAPDGKTLEEINANLDEVIALVKELQETKILPLWGTTQLFLHPRYMHGGATSSEVAVYAYAAAQVKKAMEVTHYLGGENYVFWGGRECYQTLLNTDMGREPDHLARFLEAAVAYKKKIGFHGTLLIEPKPQEPTKHQYDWDAATTVNFLRKYGLIGEFKLNIECNHATLSGHSCHHDIETARINDLLGNIDANTGDPKIGWDTDQFLTDIAEVTMVMYSVVRNGGLATGGFNFDAKLRRESTDVEDLFIAHIGGMDTLAHGLRNVAKLIDDDSVRNENIIGHRKVRLDRSHNHSLIRIFNININFLLIFGVFAFAIVLELLQYLMKPVVEDVQAPITLYCRAFGYESRLVMVAVRELPKLCIGNS